MQAKPNDTLLYLRQFMNVQGWVNGLPITIIIARF